MIMAVVTISMILTARHTTRHQRERKEKLLLRLRPRPQYTYLHDRQTRTILLAYTLLESLAKRLEGKWRNLSLFGRFWTTLLVCIVTYFILRLRCARYPLFA